MDSQRFRRACAKFATGVAIATVRGPNGEPHGMTVNSFTAVSLHPPLVLICVDRAGNLAHLFRECACYGINVLHESQRELSDRFARKSGDRFDGVEWREGASGVPLLDGALARLECVVRQRADAGDHTVLIAEVTHCDVREGAPLLFFDSGYRQL